MSIQLLHPFLNQTVFLSWSCVSSLYILGINLLSDIWFGNIFSHSVACLFILLIVSLWCRSFSVWCSPLSDCCFCCLCFWCHLQKKLSPRPMSRFSPIFSSRNFIVSGLIFTFKALICLFLWCKTGSQFYSFACENHFQHHLSKRLSFPQLSILGYLVKYQLTIFACIYFWAQFCFIGLTYLFLC